MDKKCLPENLPVTRLYQKFYGSLCQENNGTARISGRGYFVRGRPRSGPRKKNFFEILRKIAKIIVLAN